MKNSIRNALCAATVCLVAHANSQGTFQNLNFEQAAAHVAPTLIGGWGDFIDPALAFPGWNVWNAGGRYPVCFYNDLSIGAPAVCLMGPAFPNGPGYSSLQGSYSVLLQYFGVDSGEAPKLSQTGTVPADAKSISFVVLPGQSDIAVSLGGVSIPLVQAAGGRLAGDVTAFAGSTVQLTFSTTTDKPAGYGDWAYFDDVRFSSSPAPEPSTLALFKLGFVLLSYRVAGLCRRPNR